MLRWTMEYVGPTPGERHQALTVPHDEQHGGDRSKYGTDILQYGTLDPPVPSRQRILAA